MGLEGQARHPRKLDWLDYTRFAAAAAVMMFHYLAFGPRKGVTGAATGFGLAGGVAEYGYLGVDVFFLISGYVILYSALGRRPDQFAVARAVRLWATFVVCMTLTVIAKALWAPPEDHITLVRYLANLSMIPRWFGQKAVDGVYWTLEFELMFYAAVFLVMALGQIKRARGIVIGWVALMVAARLALVFHYQAPHFFSGYYTLFAAGCVLALMRRHGPTPLLLVAFAAAALLSVEGAYVRAVEMTAAVPVLLPWISALVVAAAYVPFLVFAKGGPSLPGAGTAGRVTYPLYLLHAHLGYLLIIHLPINKWLAVGLTGAAMIFLAWLVYRFFEEPTEDWRRRAFDLVLGAPIRFVLRLKPTPPAPPAA
jgi:peptidoglycan/LPS O-acetylase OafA/YrhL